MISSVLSLYNDVVDVMPTKCLQAKNLFHRIKRIIGLKEIGFQVLPIITDNNDINLKNHIFLFLPINVFNCISTPSY